MSDRLEVGMSVMVNDVRGTIIEMNKLIVLIHSPTFINAIGNSVWFDKEKVIQVKGSDMPKLSVGMYVKIVGTTFDGSHGVLREISTRKYGERRNLVAILNPKHVEFTTKYEGFLFTDNELRFVNYSTPAVSPEQIVRIACGVLKTTPRRKLYI